MSDDPALPKLTLGGITVWDAREWFPTKTGGGSGAVVFRPRTYAQIEGVAIHHDAVAFSGLDLDFDGSTVDEERARMQASYNWHTMLYPQPTATRGDGWNWPAMGYHLYSFPSGRIYLVGDILTIRAHVAYLNTPLIGIVGAGDFTIKRPQGAHVVSYGQAVAYAWLARGSELPVECHRTWAEQTSWLTSCPGDTYNVWVPDVRRVAKQAYKTATAPPLEDFEMQRYTLIGPRGGFYEFVTNGVIKHHVFNGSTVADRVTAGLLPATVIHLSGSEAAELLEVPDGPPIL
jgi:hypothetical protein